MIREQDGQYVEPPIHAWFGLTYASYLVVPRSVLQEMPVEWQEKLVALMEELQDSVDQEKVDDNYTVSLRRPDGRFAKDPLCQYRHGNPHAQELLDN